MCVRALYALCLLCVCVCCSGGWGGHCAGHQGCLSREACPTCHLRGLVERHLPVYACVYEKLRKEEEEEEREMPC